LRPKTEMSVGTVKTIVATNNATFLPLALLVFLVILLLVPPPPPPPPPMFVLKTFNNIVNN